MIALLSSYVSGLLTLLVFDGVMIWFVILPLFKRYIPTYINTDMNLIAAVLFYLLYVAVALYLVVLPGIRSGCDLCTITRNAALLGFAAYMTYELTSMSVMKGWNWEMVIIDTSWGTLLTLIVSVVMWYVYNLFI